MMNVKNDGHKKTQAWALYLKEGTLLQSLKLQDYKTINQLHFPYLLMVLQKVDNQSGGKFESYGLTFRAEKKKQSTFQKVSYFCHHFISRRKSASS